MQVFFSLQSCHGFYVYQQGEWKIYKKDWLVGLSIYPGDKIVTQTKVVLFFLVCTVRSCSQEGREEKGEKREMEGEKNLQIKVKGGREKKEKKLLPGKRHSINQSNTNYQDEKNNVLKCWVPGLNSDNSNKTLIRIKKYAEKSTNFPDKKFVHVQATRRKSPTRG
ncbi:hypothetical protein VTN77DRAFT_9923 [Rasamsonia byssochlamydoides]|uniref:uncharacterized protein n=1 Tax=Rasamsonia byssochlamydoides TaxID=89139 RepID=UPI00374213C4